MSSKTVLNINAALLAGAALLLSGCANMIYPEKQPLGNASKHNAAVHVVDPDPPAYETPPDLSGKRGGVAIERYHRNRTLTPETVETSGETN